MNSKNSDCSAVMFLLSMFWTLPTSAMHFAFVNVGDTATSIPGGAGNFTRVELPAISDGLVAFRGEGLGQQGVYTRSILGDPTISVIADSNMFVPGGAGGLFQSVSPPSLHMGDIAFAATGTNGEKGIYARINGVLNVVADLNTVVPNTAFTFTKFFDPWVYDGAVVFKATSSAGIGNYTTQGGSLRTVVDTNTAIPGGSGNFTSFLGLPSFDDDKTVFYGLGSNGQRGLYLEQPGSGISLIADLNTPSPIGGNFTQLGSTISAFNIPKIEDDVIYFTAHDGNGDVGLYRHDQNGISAIVDAGNTMLAEFPGEIFDSIRGFGVSDGAVAFLGSGHFSNPTGITDGVYTTLGGSLIKVLNNDDLLNGLDHGSLGVYGQGIDGNMIAFNALTFGPDEIRANFVAISHPVTIDIKPGSDPNAVNPRSKGVIPVAVLGSMDFDAPQVDFSTVGFGPDQASPVHDGHVEDVNGDGFNDMVFHFKVSDTGIMCGDTDATLTGETFGGDSITGTDAVKTVGCK